MNEDGRFIPPGPGRSAAFSHMGGFGKSPLLAIGCGLLAIAATASFFNHLFAKRITAAFRDGLGTAVSRASSPMETVDHTARVWLGLTVPFFMVIAGGVLLGALLPALLARRQKGVTAVPLPTLPRARFSIGAVRVFGGMVFIAGFLLAVRGIPLHPLDPVGWITAYGRLALRFFTVLGVTTVLTGAAEALILRHLAFHALFLNRSEFQREMRNQEGARDVTDRGRRRIRGEATP